MEARRPSNKACSSFIILMCRYYLISDLVWADVAQEPDGNKIAYFLTITTKSPLTVSATRYASTDGIYKLPCDSRTTAIRVNKAFISAVEVVFFLGGGSFKLQHWIVVNNIFSFQLGASAANLRKGHV